MIYCVSEISGRDGWNDFLSFPQKVYRDDPNWVAPMISEVRRVLNNSGNPYFKNAVLKLFVCYCEEKPVCRSILVINRLHWNKWGKKTAFFGFFESMNDNVAVKYLFERIETDSRKLGAEYLEGPLNPNHYSELGLLLDNFSVPPVFFETYNPSYYPFLIESAGFSELCRFHTRINNDINATLSKSVEKPDPAIINKDITIRKFNIFRLNRDLEIMREINNDAFENNWYFLPLTREEYKFSAKYMFLVTTPGLVLIAEYKGQPVGALQCVINFNSLIKPLKGRIMPWQLPGLLLKRRRLKELVIFTVGIKKPFRHTAVSAIMIKSALRILKKYSVVTTTWISDDNKTVIYISDLFEMKPYKHFGIYSKPL
jgi:hypothetical protein